MAEKKFIISPEDQQRLQSLRLLDDDFMRLVFEDNIEATELLLNVFFDRYDMKVLRVQAQQEIKNPNGRSVRLDIYAVDSDNRHYDIEIQRQDRGAGEHRARFNSSMLDSKLLQAGQDPDELPDSYIIFITENDIYKENRPIYRFHRREDETGKLFNDGSHIIYVNAAYQDDGTRIGQLMHDFRCNNADDMNNKVIADKVRYFKETERGHGSMCKIFEEIYNEGAQKAKSETSIEIATTMLKDNQLSFALIAKYAGLSLQEVEKLAKSLA